MEIKDKPIEPFFTFGSYTCAHSLQGSVYMVPSNFSDFEESIAKEIKKTTMYCPNIDMTLPFYKVNRSILKRKYVDPPLKDFLERIFLLACYIAVAGIERGLRKLSKLL